MNMFVDASAERINTVLTEARLAFNNYKKFSLNARANFMKEIGIGLQYNAEDLIKTAMAETNLTYDRLKGELSRTVFQLNQYGEAAQRGQWLEACIDTAMPDRIPPKPDLRKMLVALGPVVVFGASNFPFAFSTAGGDTACAFAAGCPVIVKAHPAHAHTSEKVAQVILTAAHKYQMPKGIFAHVHGAGMEVGKALVMHDFTAAVSFTGSLGGGRQLLDWGNQRKKPIPIFSEMGSVNPVFLLPEKLSLSHQEMARIYADSITQGVGQFCTNPGLIIGIESPYLQKFMTTLGNEIKKIAPKKMLHPGIAKSFDEKTEIALHQKNVETVAVSAIPKKADEGTPTLATATGHDFLNNLFLHHEVFGPYCLVIRCCDIDEMTEVAKRMEGQLTTTLMATDNDLAMNNILVEQIKNICGRFVINGVPTGVEVCLSMQHGGPYPATTDSRYTSVGADGIKRFARPLSFQNWGNQFLPDELKDENPLKIWRTVNNELTIEKIE